MGVQARDILMAMFQLSKEIRQDSRQSPTHEDNMDVATKPVTSDFLMPIKQILGRTVLEQSLMKEKLRAPQ